jgi:hypothetical protein
VYVFVRTDLPIEQQIVQAGHAALEAGHEFDKVSDDVSSLIILRIKSKAKLENAIASIRSKGIRMVEFHEPDWDYGLTAAASEPIFEDSREAFKRYNLWKS